MYIIHLLKIHIFIYSLIDNTSVLKIQSIYGRIKNKPIRLFQYKLIETATALIILISTLE